MHPKLIILFLLRNFLRILLKMFFARKSRSPPKVLSVNVPSKIIPLERIPEDQEEDKEGIEKKQSSLNDTPISRPLPSNHDEEDEDVRKELGPTDFYILGKHVSVLLFHLCYGNFYIFLSSF